MYALKIPFFIDALMEHLKQAGRQQQQQHKVA
jgi:hypothetical protein